MRDSITGDAIFNANQMTRGVDPRPVVLVESDSDQSILAPHMHDEFVRSAPGFGKSTTLLAAQLHAAEGDDWVIAVVDRDLDGASPSSNVVSTSYYDLEAEIVFVCSAQLSRFIYSYIVSESITHEVARGLVDLVRREAVSLAAAIGLMRQHAVSQRLVVSFSSLPIKEIAKHGEPENYIESAARFACLKAGAMEHKGELESAAKDGIGVESVEYVCNGHDLLVSMCVFIGIHAGHRPSNRDFARGLHASVPCTSFRSLSVVEPLQEWLLGLTGEQLWDCAA